MFTGALIDAFLAALALVPVVGDFIDLGASAVALVLLVTRLRQFASILPGGLACLALYAFLWFEASLLPDQLPLSAVHHALWFYPVIVIASALAGGAILAAATMLLGLMYHRDRAKAIFCTIGFPWFLITLFLTIFLPHRHLKRAH
jgi:branched-subunit amino acid ABC-type transport system permease component